MCSMENKPFKRSLDFTRNEHENCTENMNPPEYSQSESENDTNSTKDNISNSLILKKSWHLALGPIKQVPINLFIMYMTGNSIFMFSILVIFLIVLRQIVTLLVIQKTFQAVEGIPSWDQKCVLTIGILVNIGLVLYKCHDMGLFPSYISNWTAIENSIIRLKYRLF